MLALMHEGTPYGHLTVGSEALSDTKLARMVGESAGKVRRLLQELEAHNVFSRTETGTIYSRRMIRDEHIRNVRAESGKKGGNPNLIDPPLDNDLVNQSDNQKPTPSSSTASAVSPSEINNLTNTLRAALLEKMPAEYRGDLEAFLRGVGSVDRVLSWIRSIDALLSGMRPPHVTPEVMGACLRQFVGNGDRPNWRLFEAYLRNESAPKEAEPAAVSRFTRAPADTTRGDGLLLIGNLRQKRKHHAAPQGGGSYVIERSELEALQPTVQSAIGAIGGLHKIANAPDDQFPILASQFAAMYAAALTKTPQESAA